MLSPGPTTITAALAAVAAGAGDGPQLDGIVGWLLDQGPFGLAIAIIGYGWKREAARADAERAANVALAREIIDKIVPVLGESTRASADLIAYSRERN